jgi:diguanylate cyclase (GGDEF)-like protein
LSAFWSTAVTAAAGVAAGLGLAALPLWHQRRAALTARWHADHDPVTGLANRRVVTHRLEQAARQARPHGLVLLDLDNFKTINDTFGHPAGDELLAQVGQRLAALLADRPGALAARLSGDEFVLVVEGSASDVAAVATAAGQAISGKPAVVADQPIRVRASVGYAIAVPGAAPEALLRDADMAMYRAKTGRTGPATPAGPVGQVDGQPAHPPPGWTGRCRDWPR